MVRRHEEKTRSKTASCSRRLGHFFLVLWPLAMVVFFFRGILLGDEAFAFRDIVHFYHPQNAWIDAARLAGQSVQWMPFENDGQPLAATATAAVYYPPKMLRLLVADKPVADALYLGMHLLLAAITCYRLGRHFGRSRQAALFGGLAYAFGGSVLYQYANEPFLIGAAWMPEAIRQLDRLWRTGRWRHLSAAAVVMALMILGGDPQAVYHVGLILLLLLSVTLGCSRWRMNRSTSFRFGGRILLCLAAFLLTGLLAAIQILPSLELTRLSERTLLPETQRLAVDLFHVPPIRLLELLCPNIGGRQFPIHARWFNLYEPRIWVPALFMGVLPFLLAIGSFRLFAWRRRADRATIFLSWLAALAIILSFGRAGGLYALLLECPGYAAFRYPGKWLPVATLALALLGARGLDRLLRDARFCRRFSWLLAGLCLALSLYAGSTFITGSPIPHDIPACVLFGPYDAATGTFFFRSALLQAAVVLALTCCILRFSYKRFPRAVLLLALLAVDLAVANGWIVATCPREALEPQSPIWREIVRHAASEPSRPIRVYRCPIWYPPTFLNTRSENRLAETVCWDVATLWPKYHLLYNLHSMEENGPEAASIMLLDVRGTMISGEYYAITNRLRQHWYAGTEDFETGVADLGAEWVIAPAGRPLNPALAESVEMEDAPEATALWRIRRPNPSPSYDAKAVFRDLPWWQDAGTRITLLTMVILVIVTVGRSRRFRRRHGGGN